MPVLVYFLMVTMSFNETGQFAWDHIGVFPSLTECETAAYNAQDYTIDYEKANKAEVTLTCVKHDMQTI